MDIYVYITKKSKKKKIIKTNCKLIFSHSIEIINFEQNLLSNENCAISLERFSHAHTNAELELLYNIRASVCVCACLCIKYSDQPHNEL